VFGQVQLHRCSKTGELLQLKSLSREHKRLSLKDRSLKFAIGADGEAILCEGWRWSCNSGICRVDLWKALWLEVILHSFI